LKSEVQFNFDIFIKIHEKYIHYVSDGDDLSAVRLSKLKKNKVRQLFIKSEHEKKYQDFLDSALLDCKNNVMMSTDEKAEVISNYSTQAADEVLRDPESEDTYHKAEKAAQGIVDIIAKNDDVLKQIIKRTSVSMDDELNEVVVKHCINVASFASRLGEIMAFSDDVLSDLGIAGLYHDVGLTKLPPKILELIKVKEEDMQSNDFELYKKHPTIGADLLTGKEYAKKSVVDFISRHEEKKSGKGYPNGIKKISAEQEVFNICCYFSKRFVCMGEKAEDILKEVDEKESSNYDPQIIDKFKIFLREEGIIEG
jgi:HD-GYP domain-containing protein (c-di-GMP phosphodiesterase class II)